MRVYWNSVSTSVPATGSTSVTMARVLSFWAVAQSRVRARIYRYLNDCGEATKDRVLGSYRLGDLELAVEGDDPLRRDPHNHEVHLLEDVLDVGAALFFAEIVERDGAHYLLDALF